MAHGLTWHAACLLMTDDQPGAHRDLRLGLPTLGLRLSTRRNLPRDGWLEFYSRRFDTVELNNSFYRLPAGRHIRRLGPRAFPMASCFAVKASRYLTHMSSGCVSRRSPSAGSGMRLGVSATVSVRCSTSCRRGGGPIRFVWMRSWMPCPRACPRRSSSGTVAGTVPRLIATLDRAGVALCLHDMPGSAPRPEPVGPLVYVRFHGSGTDTVAATRPNG